MTDMQPAVRRATLYSSDRRVGVRRETGKE